MAQQIKHTADELAAYEKQITSLKEKIRLVEHEKNKKIIELQCELDYERKRAEGFQQKFKIEVLSKTDNQTIKQLTDKLNAKQNQILQIRVRDIEKKKILSTRYQQAKLQAKKVPSLLQRIHEQQLEIDSLKEEIDTVKYGAVEAIMEKQNQIALLEEQLRLRQSMSQTTEFLELKQKLDDTLEAHQKEVRNLQSIIEMKKSEVNKLAERIEIDQQQYEQRLAKLESEINERIEQNLAETLNYAKANQNSLLNNLENLQQRLSKYENKNLELERMVERSKIQIEFDKRRFENELETIKQRHEQELTSLFKQNQKTIKVKEREVADLKSNYEKIEKSFNQFKKKQVVLQTQKKKQQSQHLRKGSDDFITEKMTRIHQKRKESQQIENTEATQLNKQLDSIKELETTEYSAENWSNKKSQQEQISDNAKLAEKSAIKQEKSVSEPVVEVVQKRSQSIKVEDHKPTSTIFVKKEQEIVFKKEELNRMIKTHLDEVERLKKELTESEQNIEGLNNHLIALTKQIQVSRQTIIQLTQKSKRSSKESQLIVELQSLKQHTYKVESNLLTEKLKHAEELDFHREQYIQEKKQLTKKLIKVTEQKSGLEMHLEKIIKKTGITNIKKK